MSHQNLSFDSIFTFPNEYEKWTRKNHEPHVSSCTRHNSLIPFPSRGQNEIFTTSALRGIEVNHFALPPHYYSRPFFGRHLFWTPSYGRKRRWAFHIRETRIRVIHGSVRVHKKQQLDPSSFPYHGRYFFPYSTCTSRRILHRTRESMSLLHSKRIRDRVRYVAFSMLLLKRGDPSQYSNWLRHSSIWFIHFSAHRLFISSFHLFLLIRFLLFCMLFFLYVFFIRAVRVSFVFSLRGLLYIIVFAYNVYRKMKFNARIDKLNMNLHAFNRLMNC